MQSHTNPSGESSRHIIFLSGKLGTTAGPTSVTVGRDSPVPRNLTQIHTIEVAPNLAVASSIPSLLATPASNSLGVSPGAIAPVGYALAATNAPTLVTTAGSGFQINLIWDNSVATAPPAFKTDIIAAAKYLESRFNNAVTLDIHVGYDEINGMSLGSSALGESEGTLTGITYAQMVAALKSHALDATNANVIASLTAQSPVNGMYLLADAEAKALGLPTANGGVNDGYIGFGVASLFSFNDSTGVGRSQYDFTSTALHEITEVMGRTVLTGSKLGTPFNYYDLMDLLHYSSSGVRDFSATNPGYLSVNGGASNLGSLNTNPIGDAGDWGSSVTNNSFGAFSYSGVVNEINGNDLTLMNALGWNLNSNRLNAAPTGITAFAATGTLAAAQASGGLAANVNLASIFETGDYAWDNYSFALGGSGAASFKLSSNNDKATLTTGASGVAGAAGGAVYQLTITIADATLGTNSTTLPLDAVVGGNGNNTINLATLLGPALGTPVFVYGGSGNDTITATGLTGAVTFDGGAGADTFTGGSGVNSYVYGAAGDSTPSAMDVITNFNTAQDTINLAGLGVKLTDIGLISGGSMAADQVGWVSSGGNVYVDVNSSSGPESLSALSMRIELQGSVALSGSNILHL